MNYTEIVDNLKAIYNLGFGNRAEGTRYRLSAEQMAGICRGAPDASDLTTIDQGLLEQGYYVDLVGSTYYVDSVSARPQAGILRGAKTLPPELYQHCASWREIARHVAIAHKVGGSPCSILPSVVYQEVASKLGGTSTNSWNIMLRRRGLYMIEVDQIRYICDRHRNYHYREIGSRLSYRISEAASTGAPLLLDRGVSKRVGQVDKHKRSRHSKRLSKSLLQSVTGVRSAETSAHISIAAEALVSLTVTVFGGKLRSYFKVNETAVQTLLQAEEVSPEQFAELAAECCNKGVGLMRHDGYILVERMGSHNEYREPDTGTFNAALLKAAGLPSL